MAINQKTANQKSVNLSAVKSAVKSTVKSATDQGELALNEVSIREFVKSSSDLIATIEVFPSLSSTNSYLLEQPVVVGKAKICLTESQLSGRGRRGNSWRSADNKNITLSLSWGFDAWPDTVTGLGLAAGLVVAERLNRDFQIGVGIKWPNDLLINGDKLAGILIEVSANSSGQCNVVIGIGLNVHQPDWSKQLDLASDVASSYRWTDLRSYGVHEDRNILVATIIDEWLKMLTLFEVVGFGIFVERWNQLSCHTNMEVVLIDRDGQDLSGRMLGVTELGELLIETEDGETQTINNSNLSLRLVN